MAVKCFVGKTPIRNEIFVNVSAKNKIINKVMTAILMLSILIFVSGSCSADVVVSPPHIDQTNHYPGDVVQFSFDANVIKYGSYCAFNSCALDILKINITNGESMNCNLPTRTGNYSNYNCGGQNISVMVSESGCQNTIINFGYNVKCSNVYYYMISWQIPCNWNDGIRTIKVHASSGFWETNISETTFNIIYLNCSIDGDIDNDGYNNTCCNGIDCNDNDNTIHPGVIDIPNNAVDENCNGHDNIICYVDSDNDHYTNNDNSNATYSDSGSCPTGYMSALSTTNDCNDNNSSIHPGATEIINGMDDNCDGSIDNICIFPSNRGTSCENAILPVHITTKKMNYNVGEVVTFDIYLCWWDLPWHNVYTAYLNIYYESLKCKLPNDVGNYQNYGDCNLTTISVDTNIGGFFCNIDQFCPRGGLHYNINWTIPINWNSTTYTAQSIIYTPYCLYNPGSGITYFNVGSDSDGDGINNSVDNCPRFYNLDQADKDNDTIGDQCDNCPSISNFNQSDFDKDTIGDACDSDDDNDGVNDTIANYLLDNCHYVPNPGQGDLDRDGVGDSCDNCQWISNPNQIDTNDDGKGNACDDAIRLWSSDSSGNNRYIFWPDEPVYVTGTLFPANTLIDIYIMQDRNEWFNGDNLTNYFGDNSSFETVTTDANGNFSPTVIWPPRTSQFGALFDIITDITWNGTRNGKYDYGEQIDSIGAAGFRAEPIWASNSSGNDKNTFYVNEPVYVKGKGFLSNFTVDIYVVKNKDNWVGGENLTALEISGVKETITTDSNGNLPTTIIWTNPLPGEYDVVADWDRDGIYDKNQTMTFTEGNQTITQTVTETVDDTDFVGFRVMAIWIADLNKNIKNIFGANESIYITGNNLTKKANKTITIYVVSDYNSWIGGEKLVNIFGNPLNIMVDYIGNIPLIKIASACRKGDYDLVADTNLNGIYDSEDYVDEWEKDGFNIVCNDTDGDKICNLCDNCPSINNTDLSDNDNDEIGDVCDNDKDNDGINNSVDNCQFIKNLVQTDTDNDGVGDPCDMDMEGDTIPDLSDNCPHIPNKDQKDTDGDRIGDMCDIDDDNDSIPDTTDNCQIVSNPDQKDVDGDKIGDVCDTSISTGESSKGGTRYVDATQPSAEICGNKVCGKGENYPNCPKDCPKPLECTTDSNCLADEICKDNKCVKKQECIKDSDCNEGKICRNEKCVIKPECVNDSDCQADKICKNEKCVIKPECTSDSDCKEDKICKNEKCVPKIPELKLIVSCPKEIAVGKTTICSVKDENNNPVPDANVAIRMPDKTTKTYTTDTKGNIEFIANESGKIDVTASKNNYAESEKVYFSVTEKGCWLFDLQILSICWYWWLIIIIAIVIVLILMVFKKKKSVE
ncbi:MAG: hypothetical protein BWK75_02640 [Candidatus Altiarchaeales archaeon A3]|nr:MAG: hypothetical protein BWK75_02640 [Candidatus Altiarchaeales archaeon A3]